MLFTKEISVFGDARFRGKCRRESIEQIDCFAYLKHNHPELYAIAIHPKLEGVLNYKQVTSMRASGSLNAGASDIIIPGAPAFVCEIKRKDHTKSRWAKDQQGYLLGSQKTGAFACVALGFEGFKLALEAWNDIRNV